MEQVDGALSLEQQLGKISLGPLEQQLGKVTMGRVSVGPPEHQLGGLNLGAMRQQLGKINLAKVGLPKLQRQKGGESSSGSTTGEPLQQRSKSLEETKHTKVITQQPQHRSKSLDQPNERKLPLRQPPPARKVTIEEQLADQKQQRRQPTQRGRSMSLTSLTFVKMRKLFTFRRRTRSLRVRPSVGIPDRRDVLMSVSQLCTKINEACCLA